MSAEQDLANANVQIANLISEVTRFRDAAMGLNAVYPTITEGRQAVADGKYFSVPGNGAYMRLYRRTGSSAALIAEFPDRAQVQGIVDVLGGRGVTGPGDLMAQGAFGFGAATSAPLWPLASLDDDPASVPSGLYRVSQSVPGSPGFGTLSWQRYNATEGSLTWRNIAGATVRVQERSYSGRWGEWSRVFHDRNILGTVSQSGGVPTGAIMERGSNANGEYTVFADGFCRCIRRNFVVSAPSANRYTGTWTFPRSFSSEAHVGVTVPFSSLNYTDLDSRRNISTTGAGGGKTSSALIEIYPIDGYTIPVNAELGGITLIAEGYIF